MATEHGSELAHVVAHRRQGRDGARGDLTGERCESFEHAASDLDVVAGDGDLCVAHHARHPVAGIARHSVVGGGEPPKEAVGVVEPTVGGVVAGEHGSHRVLQRRHLRELFEDGRIITQDAALVVEHPDLDAEEHPGIGLATVGADAECLGRQRLCGVDVTGDLGPVGLHDGALPAQQGLVESLDGEGPGDVEAAVHLGDITRAEGNTSTRVRGPVEQGRIADVCGSTEPLVGPSQRLLEEVRQVEGERDVGEGARDGRVVAGRSGERDRLVSQRLSALEIVVVHQLGAQGAEEQRPRRVIDRELVEGQFEELDPVRVDVGPREHAAGVGQGGDGEPLGVTLLHGLPRRVEERFAEPGLPGLALGDAEPDGQVEAEDRIGGRGPSVEVECVDVVVEGVVGGEGRERGVGRPARVVERLDQAVGLGGAEPVAGQFAESRPLLVAAEALECLGHLAVRSRLAGAAEGVVQRVLDQRVGEAVVPGRVRQLAHQR